MAWRLSARSDGKISMYQSDQWLLDDGDYASVDIRHTDNDMEVYVYCFSGMEVSHVYISTKCLPMRYYPTAKEMDYWKKDVNTRERWACRIADEICRKFCREDTVK